MIRGDVTTFFVALNIPILILSSLVFTSLSIDKFSYGTKKEKKLHRVLTENSTAGDNPAHLDELHNEKRLIDIILLNK